MDQEHIVRTGSGSVSVIVYGDPDKPALITYPDLALNREFCINLGGRFYSFGCVLAKFYKPIVSSLSCRHVLFPRIVLLSRSCNFAASQFLRLPY